MREQGIQFSRLTPPPQLSLDGFDMTNGPSEPVPKKMTREEKKDQKIFVDTVMYGLSAPLIFPPGGWGESYPKERANYASIIRLASSIECYKSQMCTVMDAHAYLFAQGLVAPFTHSWSKIFFYCMSKALSKEWKIMVADDKWLERDAELDINEIDDLNRLRSWIFKHQVKYVKRNDK